ncbi:hypothetical protein CAP39_03065 [Sphingomonas sp. IBVSS1]|nr:hypothetical protein CAP39_03065 [Sphingomonas sp. IBVSS1]
MRALSPPCVRCVARETITGLERVVLRLRQIAVVADELAPQVADFTRILGAEVCYRDPGVGKYGLENALWALGGTFLEALAPTRPDTTAGRYLDRRGGPTGYMLILDTDDIAAVRLRMTMLGMRIVEDLTVDLHGQQATALHLHPRDTGGCLLSIDRHGPNPALMGSYAWAGPDWQRACRPDRAITGVVLAADQPMDLIGRWGAILARPWEQLGDTWRIRLDHGQIDVVPVRDGRGEGLSAIRVAGLAAPAHACGIDLLPEDG